MSLSKLFEQPSISHIFYIYIYQNIRDIYLNYAKIYFRCQKFHLSHIYFFSMGRGLSNKMIDTVKNKFYKI